MNKFKVFLIFVFITAFIAACAKNDLQTTQTNQTASMPASSPAATPADELASARELYSKRCVNCHKENGEGGIKDMDGEKIKVPNLKDPRVISETDDEYIEQIENGGDGMPAYKGKLTDEQIKNLVRYMRRDFQGK